MFDILKIFSLCFFNKVSLFNIINYKNIIKGVNEMEKLFKLKEHGTTVRTEILAGITTFLTMAYILAVNPSILSASGMDSTAVLLATCLASFVGTLCMAFMANLPFALSAGMGPNAFLAYTLCIGSGYSWKVALLAVFVEGIIFIILSLTPIRESIFDAIPMELKKAVSIGIGLFICFIGLQNAHIVVDGSTLVEFIDFSQNFNTQGITALLALAGIVIVAVLYIKKVPGSIFISIIAVWILGIICELTGLYVPNAEAGFSTLIPSFHMTDFSKLTETFGQCFNTNLDQVGIMNFIIIVFSFLFVDIFDTIGTLIGVTTKSGMLDENGRLPQIRPALLADAIATSAGAIFGTSTTTTFVESATGVEAGGRTGLTAFTTGILFLLSTLLAPIFIAIPTFATAPALVMVGFLMFTSVTDLKMTADNYCSAIPAYICIFSIPFFYSIAEGISLGVISYVLLNLLCGKAKNINPIMYVLSVLFILKYIFL